LVRSFFFDEIGLANFAPGQGIDVQPHPHIGLPTLTRLFAGGLGHRDSSGTVIDIAPGAVNWMTAGRGIVHSDRMPPTLRAAGHHMRGIQSWVALPVAHAEDAPAIVHHSAETFPVVDLADGRATLNAGTMFGVTSPVQFPHPIVYSKVPLEGGAHLALPAGWGDRGVYPVSGNGVVDGAALELGALAVLATSDAILTAETPLHVMILGSTPFPEPRHIEWNFVSHAPERIEAARTDWRAGRFPQVPGETEFIPLP
jgi:redox-sensitive bicupin YhaK (pirin superfamily)